MKYADDTYLVIPAYNVDSRDKEIANIDAWAKVYVECIEVSRDRFSRQPEATSCCTAACDARHRARSFAENTRHYVH